MTDTSLPAPRRVSRVRIVLLLLIFTIPVLGLVIFLGAPLVDKLDNLNETSLFANAEVAAQERLGQSEGAAVAERQTKAGAEMPSGASLVMQAGNIAKEKGYAADDTEDFIRGYVQGYEARWKQLH